MKRVDGIPETPGKTLENLEQRLQQVFQGKLDLNYSIEIKQAHQTSSRPNNDNGNKQRTIVCNLLKYKDKVKIQQKASKLRGTNIQYSIEKRRSCVKSFWKK